ncbi:urate hydroxylase PuuD [Kaistia dalseonensis]|uniref:Membrane protein n=1 Tax=Kaistia dalseonensis TaxID=410840 RepID=A0ABU0H2L4_9HYPH|nr:urate hydroxylase PuuD [Kaistia dalseonensis]MCX5493977.1 urate hydroxylase PuuD [Kaistia dalseonensis]MDQ0436553.1 putative membrane protein [Kaistia dalseonensis]
MSSFYVEWLNLLIRWSHLIVGIGWIGTSFYFIALDLSLKKREKMNPGVYGTAWEVHGGGFYHVEKYLVAPPALPSDLIWYKWEAYLTWVSGFLLLIVQYYWNANTFLIDRSVLPLLPSQAIVISVLTLVGGWLIYDQLCKSPIGKNTPLLAVCLFVLIVGAAYLLTHVFSGRGALIHVGAFIGTIMAVNVFGIIVPNQKKIVASLLKHEAPDPRLGAIGKQRSVHNNYLTLPVLLMMVSNHYPFLTGHPQSWILVAFILLLGGSIRHFLNRHEAHDPLLKYVWTVPLAAAALGVLLVMTAPKPLDIDPSLTVSDAQVLTLTAKHCTMCHAARPTHDGFDAPPKGVLLTSTDQLILHKDQIMAQAVNGTAMPLGNETHMTEEDRKTLGAWLQSH